MPIQKDLKRLVRRRMQKTGESYTAARAQIAKLPKPAVSVAAPRSARRYAKLAGMSDAAIRSGTGCTWKKWVDALDYARAHEWPHRKIAEYVQEKFDVPDWWCQAVTVGYERIRGLRAIGQRRGGGYEANKSRTFAVPVTKLFNAFAVARTRNRWLPEKNLVVRKATSPRSVRLTMKDGTPVEVWLVAKGAGKSSPRSSNAPCRPRNPRRSKRRSGPSAGFLGGHPRVTNQAEEVVDVPRRAPPRGPSLPGGHDFNVRVAVSADSHAAPGRKALCGAATYGRGRRSSSCFPGVRSTPRRLQEPEQSGHGGPKDERSPIRVPWPSRARDGESPVRDRMRGPCHRRARAVHDQRSRARRRRRPLHIVRARGVHLSLDRPRRARRRDVALHHGQRPAQRALRVPRFDVRERRLP